MTLEETVALQLWYHEVLGSTSVPPRTGTITGSERRRRAELAQWARDAVVASNHENSTNRGVV